MGVGQAASIPADAAMGRGWVLGHSFAWKTLWHGPFPQCTLAFAKVGLSASQPPAPTGNMAARRTIMDESHLAWLYRSAAVMAQVWYYVSQRYGANVFDAAVIRCRLVRGRRRAHSLARRWALEIVELGVPAEWAEAYWTRVDIIRPLL